MSIAVPLYGFGASGGGTGGTLTVTAPAGVTVTVSKDGKSKTKVADPSGLAVFKGLATGDWTVTITDGTQTATKTVAVTTDYATAMTFFTATINVTYPAGSVCTATDGVTTLTAPDTSGTWACVVPNAGTWTVSCSDGVDDAEYPVEIDTDGQIVSIELSYGYILFSNGTERVSWDKSGYGFESKYTQRNAVISDGDVVLSIPGALHVCIFGTTDVIDLSNYNVIAVNVTGLTLNASSAVIRISKNKNAASSYAAATTSIAKTGQALLDISGFSGNYYVILCTYSTEGGRSAELKFDRLELIK